jgi:hypothetical protein
MLWRRRELSGTARRQVAEKSFGATGPSGNGRTYPGTYKDTKGSSRRMVAANIYAQMTK